LLFEIRFFAIDVTRKESTAPLCDVLYNNFATKGSSFEKIEIEKAVSEFYNRQLICLAVESALLI